MANMHKNWHKCLLCDTEFYDSRLDRYYGYCPGCREHEERKEQPQGGASQDARKQD